jgi:putative protein kinase ArgK-like GTPase of G3E family
MLDLRDKGGHSRWPAPAPAAVPTPLSLQALDYADAPGRDVEILRTVAMRGEGMAELVAAIARHRTLTAPTAAARQAQRAGRELREEVLDRLGRAIDAKLATHRQLVESVQRRATDPYTAADFLLNELLREPDAATP